MCTYIRAGAHFGFVICAQYLPPDHPALLRRRMDVADDAGRRQVLRLIQQSGQAKGSITRAKQGVLAMGYVREWSESLAGPG